VSRERWADCPIANADEVDRAAGEPGLGEVDDAAEKLGEEEVDLAAEEPMVAEGRPQRTLCLYFSRNVHSTRPRSDRPVEAAPLDDPAAPRRLARGLISGLIRLRSAAFMALHPGP